MKNLFKLLTISDGNIDVKYWDSLFDKLENDPSAFNSKDLIALAKVASDKHVDKSIVNCLLKLILDKYQTSNIGTFITSNMHKPEIVEFGVENAQDIYERTNNKFKFLTFFDGIADFSVDYNTRYMLDIISKIPVEELNFEYFENLDDYENLNAAVGIFKKYGGVNDTSFVGGGTTSCVFKVGSYVVKVGQQRFSDTVPRHYRIIKSHDFIRGSDFAVESQSFLEYKNTLVSTDDIYELLVDLRKAGIILFDSLALSYDFNNFGILNSYRDADCDDPEMLPDSFKEMPFVLYDNDFIETYNEEEDQLDKMYEEMYGNGSNVTSVSYMEDAIRNYEKKLIPYVKVIM